MNNRYLNERAALADRIGDTVEVTRFSGPVEFLSTGPTAEDFIALASRAYVRGDLTVDELEAEIDQVGGGSDLSSAS